MTLTKVVPDYSRLGYALAAKVLQSDLYGQLDDVERAQCDELLAAAPDAAEQRTAAQQTPCYSEVKPEAIEVGKSDRLNNVPPTPAGTKRTGEDLGNDDHRVPAQSAASAAPNGLTEAEATTNPLRGKYGEFLTPFVNQMEFELHANSGKGDRAGWLSMSREVGLLEIYYHLAKLQKAVKKDNRAEIKEFSADVANMSMMLSDICGALIVAPGGE